jgi:flagellar assembly protein FliH
VPIKYNFDTSFGDNRQDKVQEELDDLRRQIGEAREAGRREGHAAGRAEALRELEQTLVQTLNKLIASCADLARDRQELERQLEADAANLAHAIARTLSPALMKNHPLAEIEALVADCLDGARREPRLVVRVHESLADPLGQRLDALKISNHFAGQIILLDDPALGPLDCRVEWPDGGAERDQAALHKQIEAAVGRFMAKDDHQFTTDRKAPQAPSGAQIGQTE